MATYRDIRNGIEIATSTTKSSVVDADAVLISDSADSRVAKKLTWATIKEAVASFYDGATRTMTSKTLTAPTLTTPVLGTPASGTLTNCTGLPLTGLVSDTTTAVGVGSLNVGNASDTTVTRSAAGEVAVEGIPILTETSTNTVSGKSLSGSSNTFSAIPQSAVTNLTTDLAAKVPTSRTVNSKALTADVTLTQDDVGDGSTNKVFTSTEKTKLSGIATGATANSSDATLLARANHTGTQLAATISDFSTAADARITAATGVSVQPIDTELSALAGLTSAADRLPYFTGAGTAALATFTAAGRALVDDADTAAQRTTLQLGNVTNTSDAYKLKLFCPSSWLSGNYYYVSHQGGIGSTSSVLGNGSVRVAPYYITTEVTISRLGLEYTAAGQSGSVFRIGIWDSDGGNDRPGTLLVDAGTIATDGTPAASDIALGSNLTLNPGLYYFGGAVQNASTTQPTMRTLSAPLTLGGPLGTTISDTAGAYTSILQTGVTGALSNFSSWSYSSVNAARIVFKVA